MSEQPTILIIFGISGDLSRRYLLPAIGQMSKSGILPREFRIIGITRQANVSVENTLSGVENREYVNSCLEIFQMDLNDLSEYKRLGIRIKEIHDGFKEEAQKIFYLSTPPMVAKSIVGHLGDSMLSKHKNTKLLLEKPFGTDLESARELSEFVDKYFTYEQVYRIDHYLAKENAQNIIIFRDSNFLFKKTWNKDFIESIEIIASEEVDIEGRANFYEQTGALRDVVQSHILQLVALVLMDVPKDLKDVSRSRYEALKNLNIVCNLEDDLCIKRGQYEGYREEVENPRSTVETFLSLRLASNDPKWIGVPIKIATGKALKEKITSIKIRYKRELDNEPNELLIRIQPNPGIEFSMWAKKPDLELKTVKHLLTFLFKDHYESLPEAYEQVLFSAIKGDHNLFTSSEEVLETWRILDVVQNYFNEHRERLFYYKKGSKIEELM